MTNKINGIDVSECEKLGETIDGFTCGLGKRIRFANEIITKHNLCKDNPDCYFKQLKRLQKENEELKKFKKEISKTIVLPDIEEEATNKYKQALEEIREIIEFRFKTAYMTLGLKETDKIIEDIEKIVNEVLNEQNIQN